MEFPQGGIYTEKNCHCGEPLGDVAISRYDTYYCTAFRWMVPEDCHVVLRTPRNDVVVLVDCVRITALWEFHGAVIILEVIFVGEMLHYIFNTAI